MMLWCVRLVYFDKSIPRNHFQMTNSSESDNFFGLFAVIRSYYAAKTFKLIDIKYVEIIKAQFKIRWKRGYAKESIRIASKFRLSSSKYCSTSTLLLYSQCCVFHLFLFHPFSPFSISICYVLLSLPLSIEHMKIFYSYTKTSG